MGCDEMFPLVDSERDKEIIGAVVGTFFLAG